MDKLRVLRGLVDLFAAHFTSSLQFIFSDRCFNFLALFVRADKQLTVHLHIQLLARNEVALKIFEVSDESINCHLVHLYLLFAYVLFLVDDCIISNFRISGNFSENHIQI